MGSDADRGACGGPHTAIAPPASSAPGAEELRQSAGAPGGVIARALPGGAESGEMIAPHRGRGRPKGATNLRNTALAEALIERYGDPLEADVAIGAMPAGELVTMLRVIASDRGIKLGMTLGDVVRWQADCRRNAMNYLHSKRVAVDDKGNPAVPVIGIGRADQVHFHGSAGRSIEETIDAEAVTIIEVNQGDGDATGK
jgi:hypothetical protein